MDGVNSPRRFVGQRQRMGSGKSLTAVSQGLVSKSRTMILTGLKGLQTQLEEEFGELGLAVLMGKSNYTCRDNPTHTCDEGSVGKCKYKGSSLCDWQSAKEGVMEAPLSTTNYSCWIAANQVRGWAWVLMDLLILR